MSRIGVAACAALVLLASSARAQPGLLGDMAPNPDAPMTRVAPPPPPVEPPPTEVEPDRTTEPRNGPVVDLERDATFARSLMDLRLEHRDERRRGGFWLLGWGLLNTVGGGLVLAIQHDDPAWRMAGAITASFGAINAALAFGLLDRRGHRRRAILDGRLGAHTRPDDVREEEIMSQLRSGQVFALNFGLDVFYMAVGGLLYALGRALDEPALNGAGLATAFQGAWLFGFDLAEWRSANARAEAMRALRR